MKKSSPSNGIDHMNNVFIRDGVVDPEQWFSQVERPLFLLKEAYNGDADWDLIKDHLLKDNKDDNMSKMWQRIAYYTDSIFCSLDGPKEKTISEIKFQYPLFVPSDMLS